MQNILSFRFCDTNSKTISDDIGTIFPDWGADENICVMSPHDDDAVIGAGYAMLAARQAGANVYVFIFCRGDAGYSSLEEKETIEQTRMAETLECYAHLGIPHKNILRLGFGDFSAIGRIGWTTAANAEGDMPRMLRFFRENKITRVLVPNHYREHIDHLAAHIMASYNAPQAGDPILVDYGKPHTVRSFLEYSVWADFDPEDALVNKRDTSVRANRIIIASGIAEDQIAEAIREYRSQEQIISDLIRQRSERKLKDGRGIEAYIAFDPRPKISFSPYIKFIGQIDSECHVNE